MTDKPGTRTALPSDASAARCARRFATATFEDAELGLPPFDLLLVISELVTNAVVHGSGQVALELRLRGNEVAVAVTDGGAGDPVSRALTEDLGGGRGLAIVERLSTTWGVDTSGPGKQVWAVVPFAPVEVAVDDRRNLIDA